jgi:hypothetical protein
VSSFIGRWVDIIKKPPKFKSDKKFAEQPAPDSFHKIWLREGNYVSTFRPNLRFAIKRVKIAYHHRMPWGDPPGIANRSQNPPEPRIGTSGKSIRHRRWPRRDDTRR